MFAWLTKKYRFDWDAWRAAGCRVSHDKLINAFHPSNSAKLSVPGNLNVPSGRLAVGDPAYATEGRSDFAEPDGCFDEIVAPGSYPVTVFEDGLVAAIQVRFSDEPISYLTGAFDADTRKQNALPSFGVDSAHAAVFSAESLAQYRLESETIEYDDAAHAWFEVKLADCTNLFMGQSGKGDGSYYTFWGRNAAGAIVALFVDFRELGKAAPLE